MKIMKLFVYSLILGVSIFVYQEKIYASGPIPISTVADINAITNMNLDYELMNDIDLSTLTVSPFVNFTGDFDGNGYTLSNYHINLVDNHSVLNIGFFTSTVGASIHDLKIDEFSTTVGTDFLQSNIGLLVGSATDTTFTNIIIDRSRIDSTGEHYIGGLVGKYLILPNQTNTTSNIHVDVIVNGGSHLGGLMGIATSSDTDYSTLESLEISKISTKGTYTSKDNIGGIFGDLLIDKITAVNVTSNAIIVGTHDLQSQYVFSGFAANVVVWEIDLDQVLIETNFDDQTTTNITPEALFDTSIAQTVSITNAYYIDGLGFSSSVLSPLSSNDALLQSSYVNYDFDDAWVIHPLFNEGRPYLRYPLKMITCDSNGGSAVGVQPYFPYEGSTAPSDPSLSGYTFNGWTLNGSAFDFSSTSYGSNLSLLANYTLIPVTPSPTTTTVSSTPLVSDPEPIPETGIRNRSMILFGLGFLFLLAERSLRQ